VTEVWCPQALPCQSRRLVSSNAATGAHCRTPLPVRPAAGRQVRTTGRVVSKPQLELGQGLREVRPRHDDTLPMGYAMRHRDVEPPGAEHRLARQTTSLLEVQSAALDRIREYHREHVGALGTG